MIVEGALDWLLEPENPSARYLTLRLLQDLPETSPEAAAAREAIPSWRPVREILDAQWPAGYWVRPGVGYSPKHKATVWQVIFLSALGAPCTGSLERACSHIMDHSRLSDGRFSASKKADDAVACLNGNLIRAMLHLGFEDPRLPSSIEALARMVEHDGFRCRYNATKPTPPRMHDGLPCAWGAIKVLGAFGAVPAEERSPAVQAGIEAGVEMIGGPELAAGDFATATRRSPLWHRLGFPLGFTSDLLEAMLVLGQLGMATDPRLGGCIDVLLGKRLESGRWPLEHTPKNTWAILGRIGEANKWITLRALKVLREWEETQ